VFLKHK